MRIVGKRDTAIFVDRESRRWVVRDGEGRFWTLPSTETPWGDRREFDPGEGSELDPVPGHYKYMLGLPNI